MFELGKYESEKMRWLRTYRDDPNKSEHVYSPSKADMLKPALKPSYNRVLFSFVCSIFKGLN